MLEDGTLANLQLKGSAVQQWGEFTNKNRTRLPDEWVLVKTTKDGKKGAVKFSMPEFTFEKSLSESEMVMADEVFNTLETYLKSYLVKSEPTVTLTGDASELLNQEHEEDDLEF
jgi:hypothetical protein